MSGLERLVTVLGGSGFLGRRVVAALLGGGARVRVASRRHAADDSPADFMRTDILDEESVRSAVDGAHAVVNAVGLYVERGALSFDAVHVEGAARVASAAAAAGADTLVLISGIGADPDAASAYVSARGRGEQRVMEAFPGAAVLRPSVLFGRGDSFTNLFDRATRFAPVFPLFGDGSVRIAPVHVDDLAQAIARVAVGEVQARGVFELGGAQALPYRECVERVLAVRGRRRLLLPVPFAAWELMAASMAWLPSPPITRDQIALLREPSVPVAGLPGFAELGIVPRRFDEAVADALQP